MPLLSSPTKPLPPIANGPQEHAEAGEKKAAKECEMPVTASHSDIRPSRGKSTLQVRFTRMEAGSNEEEAPRTRHETEYIKGNADRRLARLF
tara:strand:+ start:428 stop:703 length:276 start_codon:yes stop_codon:yes gene_type:complete